MERASFTLMEKLTQSPGGQAGYKGSRSYLQGPYHFCARCGSRVHISEMQWQRGLLLCTKWGCVDTGTYPLTGEREAAIAHALEVPTQELMPDPKLISPQESGSSLEDDITF
jgi:hypothetical protein